MKNLSISLAVLGVASLAALAAPLASGLRPGENVTPFHPRHLAGPLAGSTNCFPCTFQNRPQVQVWINGDAPQNVATLGKTLSSAMKTYQGKEFKALVVFLTTPKTEASVRAMVTEAAKKPELKGVGLALLDTNNEAVQAYKINLSPDVKNTVFAYKNWQVAQTFVNLKADGAGVQKLDGVIARIAK